MVFAAFGTNHDGGAHGAWVEEKSELEQALTTMTQVCSTSLAVAPDRQCETA